jgi:hypothetical protein
MVGASSRALKRAISAHRAAVLQMVERVLSASEIPSGVPAAMQLKARLRAGLAQAGVRQQRVEREADALLGSASLGDLTQAEPREIDRVFLNAVRDRVYTESATTKGFRSMGKKIGVIGPDRGFGSPRLLGETPLLVTLVNGLCTSRSLELSEFVDLARTELGFVMGPGTHSNLAKELGLWESAAIGRRLLRENQNALQRRLIRAGLARQYSDGHTEVRSYE